MQPEGSIDAGQIAQETGGQDRNHDGLELHAMADRDDGHHRDREQCQGNIVVVVQGSACQGDDSMSQREEVNDRVGGHGMGSLLAESG